MNQTSFNFEATPDPLPVRRSDPATSRKAAESIDKKRFTLRDQFVAQLKLLGKPSTAFEVAAGNESLRKRAKECIDRGMIVTKGERTCRINGTTCQTYWLPSEGEE